MRSLFIAGCILLLAAGISGAASTEGTLLNYQDALVTDNVTVVKMIVVHGGFENPLDGKIFEDGKTPVIVAAENGSKNTVKYLLKEGADPRIIDSNGKTASVYAMENDHKKINAWLENKEKKLTEKVMAERKLEQQMAKEERMAAERAAKKKAAEEKAAQRKAAREKAAAERAAERKAAQEKRAAEKAAKKKAAESKKK